MQKLQEPKDFLARNRLQHTESEIAWILKSEQVTVEILKNRRQIRFVNQQQYALGSVESPLLIESAAGVEALDFADAQECECTWEEFGAVGGYRLKLSRFAKSNRDFPLDIVLFIGLNWQTDEAVLEFRPQESDGVRIRECRWPGGFAPECVDNTIMPFMQGMIIPKCQQQEAKGFFYCADPESSAYMCFSQVLYMPWWGVEQKNGAALLIVDTPDDFGVAFHHPAGGPTLLETRFLPSLKRFDYTRRVLVKLFACGNYVSMARAYRSYLIERGRFVALSEKIARTPKVADLIGGAILHCGLLYDYQPGTIGYHAEFPEKSRLLTPASVILKQLEQLYANGLRNACLHLDGWGFAGYDALEPDSIPVGPLAGGEAGVLAINRKCHDFSWLFTLHQQYRDHYLAAAGYNADHLIRRADGSNQFEHLWCGGKNGLLCPEFSAEYTRRNNRYFAETGLQLDGSYLDVFSVCPLDECHHPEHRVTRSQCKVLRADCLNYIRTRWGIVSSEEAADWSMPYLDLVHHAPWGLYEKQDPGNPAQGIPIPLFNLVYHDALVVPWHADPNKKGGYSLPPERVPFLSALLNAGIPYISMTASAEEIAAMEPLRELHRSCGTLPMTGHHFLSADYLEEESTFSDGTVVKVNHRDNQWCITKNGQLIAASRQNSQEDSLS